MQAREDNLVSDWIVDYREKKKQELALEEARRIQEQRELESLVHEVAAHKRNEEANALEREKMAQDMEIQKARLDIEQQKLDMKQSAKDAQLNPALAIFDKETAKRIAGDSEKLGTAEKTLGLFDQLINEVSGRSNSLMKRFSPSSVYEVPVNIPKSRFEELKKNVVAGRLKATFRGSSSDRELDFSEASLPSYSLPKEEIIKRLEMHKQQYLEEVNRFKAERKYFLEHGTLRGFEEPNPQAPQQQSQLQDNRSTEDAPVNERDMLMQGLSQNIPSPPTGGSSDGGNQIDIESLLENNASDPDAGIDPRILFDTYKNLGAGVAQSGIDTATGAYNLSQDEPVKPYQMGSDGPAKEAGHILGDMLLMGRVGGAATGVKGLLRAIAGNAAVAGLQGENIGTGLQDALVSGGLTGAIGGVMGGLGAAGRKVQDIISKLKTPSAQKAINKAASLGINSPDVGSLVGSPKMSKVYESLAKMTGGSTPMSEVVNATDNSAEQFLQKLHKGIDTEKTPAQNLASKLKTKFDTAAAELNPKYDALYAKADAISQPVKATIVPPLVAKELRKIDKKFMRAPKERYTFKDLKDIRSDFAGRLRKIKGASLTPDQQLEKDVLQEQINQLDNFINQSFPAELSAERAAVDTAYKDNVGIYLDDKKIANAVKGEDDSGAGLAKALLGQAKKKKTSKVFNKLGEDEKNAIVLSKIFPSGSSDEAKSAEAIVQRLKNLTTEQKKRLFTKEQAELFDTLTTLQKYAKDYRTKINTPQTGKSVVDLLLSGVPLVAATQGLPGLGLLGGAFGIKKLLEKPNVLTNAKLEKVFATLAKLPRGNKATKIITSQIMSDER